MDIVSDIGNTLIKVALFEGDRMTDIRRFGHDDLQGLSNFIGDIGANRGKDGSDSAIISAVAGDFGAIKSLLEGYFRVFRLDKDLALPIRNHYDTKLTLGYDRVASVIGGRCICGEGGSILTINMGTCIIYDFLTDSDEYIGGAISPGLNQRLRALNSFTAKLPMVDVEECDVRLTGTNTVESIASGVMNGMIFEIEGFIKKYKKLYPELNVIISGGDARYVRGLVGEDCIYVDELVVVGLNKILKYNK